MFVLWSLRVSSPDLLRQEAARLEAEAARKEQAAAELRRQAATLPDGVDSVSCAITIDVWEGPAAGASAEAVLGGADAVRAAAEDLEQVVRAVTREADDLRGEAEWLRRKADFLQIELQPQIGPAWRGPPEPRIGPADLGGSSLV